MRFKKLQRFLSSLSPLSEDDWLLLNDELCVIHYDENVKLHSHDGVCNSILFLNDGVARSYVIDPSGRDYTCSFYFNESASTIKNVLVTDYASIIKNEKTTLLFETLTKIEVILIPANTLMRLYETNANWARLGRIIAEEAYYLTQLRTLSLLTMTASERYQQLLNHFPSSISQFPELHIASYLGITPQSLSRIKKTLTITK